MKIWNKKDISAEEVKKLHQKYGTDPLTASILLRRNVTEGSDIMFYLEDDRRFMHSPFSLNTMEDVVDRILDAKEENEKVLIFGDRDVDGITSTAILYQQLKRMGMDVTWRLPSGDDAYGLSMNAVKEFSEAYGTLLITVDCGISNNLEIEYANSLGIDVIVTDHHNPPENLPEASIILNPKTQDSGYPFKDISGCAVAFKVTEALRFSSTDLYKAEVCLLNVRQDGNAYVIECMKTHNLVKKDSYSERIVPGTVSITQTKLVEYLKGQQIFVWNADDTKEKLNEVFGGGVEFNVFDIRTEVSKLYPSLGNAGLDKIKDMSKIARYSENPATDLDGFYNIFVTYINKKTEAAYPMQMAESSSELQLVMLAAISDIMPLKNENRIFVRQGLSMINSGKIRPGLTELFARQEMLGKRISTNDLSWNIIPVLNAAGRLGQPELSLKLFLEEDPHAREQLAEKIIALNTERKALVNTAWDMMGNKPEESIGKYSGNICLILDRNIHRGVLGIVASKLLQRTKVPSIAMTFTDENTVVGSMRSNRGVNCPELLGSLGDFYINYGGHTSAAGFSLKKENLDMFLEKLQEKSSGLVLEQDDSETYEIDAELPFNYITPDLMNIVDRFEPYGELNPYLQFYSRKLKICSAQTMGKTERTHLKLTLEAGEMKWPAIWWGAGDKLGNEFSAGDTIDLLYNFTRNTYNGNETQQLIIIDARKSDS